MPIADRHAFDKALWDTFYDSYFQELLATRLSARWQLIDTLTAFLVAATAAGSTAAGWALWSDPNWKAIWATIAGVASVSSIAHRVLAVPSKVKKWEDLRHAFSELRTKLDTLRMSRAMQDDPSPFVDGFSMLRERYERVTGDAPTDVAFTDRVRVAVQRRLNTELQAKGYIK